MSAHGEVHECPGRPMSRDEKLNELRGFIAEAAAEVEVARCELATARAELALSQVRARLDPEWVDSVGRDAIAVARAEHSLARKHRGFEHLQSQLPAGQSVAQNTGD